MFQRFHLNIIAGDLQSKMLPQKIISAANEMPNKEKLKTTTSSPFRWSTKQYDVLKNKLKYVCFMRDWRKAGLLQYECSK